MAVAWNTDSTWPTLWLILNSEICNKQIQKRWDGDTRQKKCPSPKPAKLYNYHTFDQNPHALLRMVINQKSKSIKKWHRNKWQDLKFYKISYIFPQSDPTNVSVWNNETGNSMAVT